MMKPEQLRLTGVTKKFGGTVAVNDVNLSLKEGEILGLIGPNGSGKTTLINLINGVHPATSGSIHFCGEDVSKLPPHRITRKGVARTFQVVKPLVGLTLRENVMIGTLFGSSEHRRGNRTTAEKVAKSDEALQLVGLHEKRFSQTSALNGAELKRLEIARAISMSPKLILLDEVMAGLNATEVAKMTELIREFNAGGVTVIFIEHIMKAVMSISDRVMVLHHGSCLAIDRPEVVAEDPDVIGAYLGARFAQDHGSGA